MGCRWEDGDLRVMVHVVRELGLGSDWAQMAIGSETVLSLNATSPRGGCMEKATLGGHGLLKVTNIGCLPSIAREGCTVAVKGYSEEARLLVPLWEMTPGTTGLSRVAGCFAEMDRGAIMCSGWDPCKSCGSDLDRGKF
ncbi:hypothetical protein H2248_000342 [Termitomyces sp. 'cryptogamus']|nr:hypothetical protein H2248_000342 [Termitomyces sp. 'cryptogamus']